MRCITAICPAGPLKLSPATRNHVQTASRNGTPWLGISAARDEALVTDASMSGPGLVCWPIVRFRGRVAASAVHGVVETHRGLELLKVVAIHPGITKGGSQ